MNLATLLQKLEQTGSRLDNLEGAVTSIRSKLAFWRRAALIAGGIAVVLCLAWRNAHMRLEQCEKRNQIVQ